MAETRASDDTSTSQMFRFNRIREGGLDVCLLHHIHHAFDAETTETGLHLCCLLVLTLAAWLIFKSLR